MANALLLRQIGDPIIPKKTINITLNGAREDVITIYDSNNNTITACVFSSGQTSGTATASVEIGYSDTWKFVSAIAADTSTGTGNYTKYATITDATSQTVTVRPEGAVYWYGYGDLIAVAYGPSEWQESEQKVRTAPTIDQNTNSFTTYIPYNSRYKQRGIVEVNPSRLYVLNNYTYLKGIGSVFTGNDPYIVGFCFVNNYQDNYIWQQDGDGTQFFMNTSKQLCTRTLSSSEKSKNIYFLLWIWALKGWTPGMNVDAIWFE